MDRAGAEGGLDDVSDEWGNGRYAVLTKCGWDGVQSTGGVFHAYHESGQLHWRHRRELSGAGGANWCGGGGSGGGSQVSVDGVNLVLKKMIDRCCTY